MKNADLLLIEPKKYDFSNLIANTTAIKHYYSHVAIHEIGSSPNSLVESNMIRLIKHIQ